MEEYYRERVGEITRTIIWSAMAFAAALVACMVFVRVEESVPASGYVTFERSYSLYAPEDGFLASIPHREGDSVRAGEVIMAIDASDRHKEMSSLEGQIEEAEASLKLTEAKLAQAKISPFGNEHRFARDALKDAEARVRYAEAELERREDLYQRGVESESAFEKARLEAELAHHSKERGEKQLREVLLGLEGEILQEAEAEYAIAEARLKRLRQDLAELKGRVESLSVRAPGGGRLSFLGKTEEGEPVRRGELIARVGEGSPSRLKLEVDDFKAHRIQPGQRVRLKSAQANSLLEGYIRGSIYEVDIEKSPVEIPGGSEYRMELKGTIESSPVPLVAGTRVDGVIILGHRPLWKWILGLNS